MAQTSIQKPTLDLILKEPEFRQNATAAHTTENRVVNITPNMDYNLINSPIKSAIVGAVILPLIAYVADRVSNGAVTTNAQILLYLAAYGGLAGLGLGFLNRE